MILSKIFRYLSLKELFICCIVCNKWQIEAKRVISNRSQSLNIFHLFRTEDKNKIRDEENNRIEELSFFEGHFPIDGYDKYDFHSNVIKSMIKGLYSIPKIVLIIYGSFGDDVKLDQRLYQTDIVRKYLPSINCQILNLNSSCLIGSPTTSSVPIEKITHFGDLAAVSLIFLPKYRSGIEITLFTGNNMREKIFNLMDIKCILLFTTSSIFQDNKNLYLDLTSISKFISSFDHKIAFGGYNSAYFSFNKSDFLNYLLSDLNSSELETRELIGISFSGKNLKSCSIVLNTKRQNKTEAKLREFKKNLGFNPINNEYYETIGFMFTDEEKNYAFAKLASFRTIFPDCKLFGISGYGQYGYNYWPSIDDSSHIQPKGVQLSHKKPVNKKIKRKIILNSNMTTFVIINLQKNLI